MVPFKQKICVEEVLRWFVLCDKPWVFPSRSLAVHCWDRWAQQLLIASSSLQETPPKLQTKGVPTKCSSPQLSLQVLHEKKG